MYHFLSGYTSKLAGTERGVTSPETTFSTCFGSPFLPLPAHVYAEMLGKKIDEHGADVFLVNTGWTGGGYGTGERMKLSYTRAMVKAAIEGKLEDTEMMTDDIFGLHIPVHVLAFLIISFSLKTRGATRKNTEKRLSTSQMNSKRILKIRTYRCHCTGRRPSRLKSKSQEQLRSWLVLIDRMQRSQLVRNDGPAVFPLKFLHFSCA